MVQDKSRQIILPARVTTARAITSSLNAQQNARVYIQLTHTLKFAISAAIHLSAYLSAEVRYLQK